MKGVALFFLVGCLHKRIFQREQHNYISFPFDYFAFPELIVTSHIVNSLDPLRLR